MNKIYVAGNDQLGDLVRQIASSLSNDFEIHQNREPIDCYDIIIVELPAPHYALKAIKQQLGKVRVVLTTDKNMAAEQDLRFCHIMAIPGYVPQLRGLMRSALLTEKTIA